MASGLFLLGGLIRGLLRGDIALVQLPLFFLFLFLFLGKVSLALLELIVGFSQSTLLLVGIFFKEGIERISCNQPV